MAIDNQLSVDHLVIVKVEHTQMPSAPINNAAIMILPSKDEHLLWGYLYNKMTLDQFFEGLATSFRKLLADLKEIILLIQNNTEISFNFDEEIIKILSSMILLIEIIEKNGPLTKEFLTDFFDRYFPNTFKNDFLENIFNIYIENNQQKIPF